MIGLIIADINEISSIEKYGWQIIKESKIAERIFYTYQKFNQHMIVVHSRIGLVNAALTTEILISQFGVEAIYNYGAVGASKRLKVYDIVVPERIYFYDVETPWYSFGQTPQEQAYYLNSLKTSNYFNHNLASGNSFLDNTQRIEYIQKYIDVNIFDMEAAAIAQVCFQREIPLYIIKVVSDIIGYEDVSFENINDRISKAGLIGLEKIMQIIDGKLF